MAKLVGVRTAAGGTLSLEITPADVIGHCAPCRTTYREGDWYCPHLAARYGHPIAWLADQNHGGVTAATATRHPVSTADRALPDRFAVTFESPGL